MDVPLVGGTSSGGGTRSGVLVRKAKSYDAPHTRPEVGGSIGMLGRGRGETVRRWPTVGFFTKLRPSGAHAIRQSSMTQAKYS